MAHLGASLLVAFAVMALTCRGATPSTTALLMEGLELPRLPKKPLYSSLVATQWRFTVPEGILQRTFMQQGSTGRIKQVLLRLLMGQTVKIGAVGGSVTTAREDPEHGGYFCVVLKWLKEAFPKAKIIDRNGAIGGSSPMYIEHHLSTQLDPGVDLVFLEYVVNSQYDRSTIYYQDVASYERVLRSILSGDHAPPSQARPAATMLVNMWRCCSYNGSQFFFLGYPDTVEDYFHVLAQYYGVPTVSMRNGLFHGYRVGEGVFSNIYTDFPPNEHMSMTHPNGNGHRLIADIVIYAFYMVLAQMEQHGITTGDLELMEAPMPPPVVSRHLNYVLGKWNSEALSNAVVKGSDWTPRREAGKFGYATTRPGHKLRLQIPTRIPKSDLEQWLATVADSTSGQADTSHPQLLVDLGMLRSYEHMGVMEVRCLKGCKCTPMVFDTSFAKERVSITQSYPVPVTESDACILELTCLNMTTSGEHKLTLRGMAVVVAVPTPPHRINPPGWPRAG